MRATARQLGASDIHLKPGMEPLTPSRREAAPQITDSELQRAASGVL